MRTTLGVALLVISGLGCGGHAAEIILDAAPGDSAGPHYQPGAAFAVSLGAAGNDEDPAVLQARDGSLYVAWFSHAAGDDILISRTTDGIEWTTPIHVSTGTATDFGPSLYQDDAGYIHAAWFRWSTTTPPGRVVYNRSAAADDGLVWTPTTEVEVTHGNATDDWVPSITADASGRLLIAFARNTCPPPATCYGIYMSTSTDGHTWSDATVAIPSEPRVGQQLPSIARIDGEVALSWTAYDSSAVAPWANAQTGAHVRTARFDGSNWIERRDVTTRDPAAVSLFSTSYVDHAGVGWIAWLVGAASGTRVVEIPASGIGTATPHALPLDGYSPKLTTTPTPGVFLGAWVGGPDTEREIYVRLFVK
jgi:hypothetical protein